MTAWWKSSRRKSPTYMVPYLRRLYQCEHLTAREAEEFLNFCHSQVEDLRNLIREVEQEAEPHRLNREYGRRLCNRL